MPLIAFLLLPRALSLVLCSGDRDCFAIGAPVRRSPNRGQLGLLASVPQLRRARGGMHFQCAIGVGCSRRLERNFTIQILFQNKA